MECVRSHRGEDVELVLGGHCRELRVKRCRVMTSETVLVFYASRHCLPLNNLGMTTGSLGAWRESIDASFMGSEMESVYDLSSAPCC